MIIAECWCLQAPFWYVSWFNFMTWCSSAFWAASPAAVVLVAPFGSCLAFHGGRQGEVLWLKWLSSLVNLQRGASCPEEHPLTMGWACNLPAHAVISLPLVLPCLLGGCKQYCGHCKYLYWERKVPEMKIKSTATFLLHLKTLLPALCCFAASKRKFHFFHPLFSQISTRMCSAPYPFHVFRCAPQSKSHLGEMVLTQDLLLPSAGLLLLWEAQLYLLYS